MRLCVRQHACQVRRTDDEVAARDRSASICRRDRSGRADRRRSPTPSLSTVSAAVCSSHRSGRDLAVLLEATFEAPNAAIADAVVDPPSDSTPTSIDDGYDNSREALFAVACSETDNPKAVSSLGHGGRGGRSCDAVLRRRLDVVVVAVRNVARTRQRSLHRPVRSYDGSPDALREHTLRRREPLRTGCRRRRSSAERTSPHGRGCRPSRIVHSERMSHGGGRSLLRRASGYRKPALCASLTWSPSHNPRFETIRARIRRSGAAQPSACGGGAGP